NRGSHQASGVNHDPGFANVTDPIAGSPPWAGRLPATVPAATNARVLDAPARKSSNTDRPPDQDSGQTVRGHSCCCSRPKPAGRQAIVGASSLFLLLRGVPEVSTLPLIIDYPVILSASGCENPVSGPRNRTSRPQGRPSLPKESLFSRDAIAERVLGALRFRVAAKR